MSLDKLEILEQRIFSQKYPESVQSTLDSFNYAINNLVSWLDQINLESDLDELSEKKQRDIYSYKCLLVEKTIEKRKQEYRKSQSNIMNSTKLPLFKEYKDYLKKKSLLRKRNMRFYTLQFLFSRSEDYRELKKDYISDTKENSLLDKIVYDVDKVSDTLLLQLWFLWEKYESLLVKKKTKRKKLDKLMIDLQLTELKINAIWLLKDSTKTWKTIKIDKVRWSTRLMKIDSLDQADWKIILTQTPETLKSTTKEADIKKTISVFDNLYVYYRSQIYTIKNIEEKQQVLSDLKKKVEELKAIYPSKYDAEPKELEKYILEIERVLEPYTSRYEKNVKSFRIQKIKFRNPRADMAVLDWIINDLSASFNSLSMKKWSIDWFVDVIKEIIEEQRNKHILFRKSFAWILENFDQDKINDLIKENSKEQNIEFCKQNKRNLSNIKGVIENFLSTWYSTSMSPFKEFYILLSNTKWTITQSLNNNDWLTIVRKLLRIHLESKLKRYEMFRYNFENDYKLNNIKNTSENREYILMIRYRLEKYRDYLREKDFLENIEIYWDTNKRFLLAIKQISDMIVKIDKGEELF